MTDQTSNITPVSLLSLSFIPLEGVSRVLTRVSRCVIYLCWFGCCGHLSLTYFGSRVNGQGLWSACARDFLDNDSVSWVSRPNHLGCATFVIVFSVIADLWINCHGRISEFVLIGLVFFYSYSVSPFRSRRFLVLFLSPSFASRDQQWALLLLLPGEGINLGMLPLVGLDSTTIVRVWIRCGGFRPSGPCLDCRSMSINPSWRLLL